MNYVLMILEDLGQQIFVHYAALNKREVIIVE